MNEPSAPDPSPTVADAIIVAGGSGLRMRSVTRKQYLPISGTPILSHTLRVFGDFRDFNQIILVIPEADFDFCRTQIIPYHDSSVPVSLVAGGLERQESVYAGLQALSHTSGIVVIHDAVRPFIRSADITACIAGARKLGACILGIPAFDTLKQTAAGVVTRTIDRSDIWMAQTPQAFQYDLIKKAHDAAKAADYVGTDDASLVERIGYPVHIIPGNRANIKITSPEDLSLAEALFSLFRPT